MARTRASPFNRGGNAAADTHAAVTVNVQPHAQTQVPPALVRRHQRRYESDEDFVPSDVASGDGCSSDDGANDAASEDDTRAAATLSHGRQRSAHKARSGPATITVHGTASNGTVCTVCHMGGRLVVCGSCGVTSHLPCCTPPLWRVPKTMWRCAECRPNEAMQALAKSTIVRRGPSRRWAALKAQRGRQRGAAPAASTRAAGTGNTDIRPAVPRGASAQATVSTRTPRAAGPQPRSAQTPAAGRDTDGPGDACVRSEPRTQHQRQQARPDFQAFAPPPTTPDNQRTRVDGGGRARGSAAATSNSKGSGRGGSVYDDLEQHGYTCPPSPALAGVTPDVLAAAEALFSVSPARRTPRHLRHGHGRSPVRPRGLWHTASPLHGTMAQRYNNSTVRRRDKSNTAGSPGVGGLLAMQAPPAAGASTATAPRSPSPCRRPSDAATVGASAPLGKAAAGYVGSGSVHVPPCAKVI